MEDGEALLASKDPPAPLTLPEAHVTAARVQARAINNLTLVLALGGLVVLLAILYESHAWRQTVWHVVDQALVVESKVPNVEAWRDVMKDFVAHFPRWPLG